MPVRKGGWLVVFGAAVASAALFSVGAMPAADGTSSERVAEQTAAPGQLTGSQLGMMIKAMGIKEVSLEEKRYDFAFSTIYGPDKEPWNLSMSAVLSENGQSIWVMAWLDQCPKSPADVPRTALLRLLAQNDKVGNGKFFAYIPSNNRFVLQRVIPNQNMTTASFRAALQDLGMSVVETYDYWSVENWKQTKGSESMPENKSKSAPAQPATETHRGRQVGNSQPAGRELN
jgi:hypothetical protein